ncbi:hypothetical protein BT96DRAFT_1001755 [Gymnopus androsaceus JB14]|uniref:Uncharacterized protein n=1 Tax=Gymnopus androsaceus JB14 TaxID=1447944 RepID=A0A6A4GZV2_9AGAR|nr:hypothetical protein BT96DRAFT_1001755 [Gymnopus androsaceus JB14]
MSTLLTVADGINPRVNSGHLHSFLHKYVLLPCLVQWEDKDLGMMNVQAANGGTISVSTSRLDKEVVRNKSKFVEILGQVYQLSFGDLAVLAMRITNLSENFDLDMANEVIKFIHDPRFSEIFNPNGSTAPPILLSAANPPSMAHSPLAADIGLDNLGRVDEDTGI